MAKGEDFSAAYYGKFYGNARTRVHGATSVRLDAGLQCNSP